MKYALSLALLLSTQSVFAGWVLKQNLYNVDTTDRTQVTDSFLVAIDALDIMNADALSSPSKSVVVRAQVQQGSYDWINDANCTTSDPSFYSDVTIEQFTYIFYYSSNQQQQFQLQGTGYVPPVDCDVSESEAKFFKAYRKPTFTKL